MRHLLKLVNYARIHGCALLVLRDKRDMMQPCYEYMTTVLQNAGVAVRHVVFSDVSGIKKELFMSFANIWVLGRNKLPLTVKKTPWIALQTEHPFHRVGRLPAYIRYLQHCDQVWDFGLRFFRGTRSIFFPHMLYPKSYMIDVPTSFAKDVGFAGKLEPVRMRILKKVKGSMQLIRRSRNGRELVQKLGLAAVCPMISRQRGNFELHRFASLISAGTRIVAEHVPGNEKVEALFAEAVDFVPNQQMSSKINECVIENRLGIRSEIQEGKRRAEARQWFIAQEHEYLLKQIMETLEVVKAVSDEEAMKIIRGYIERREPFSMVRFGEGEGRVLGISKTHPKSFDSARMKMECQTGIVYGDASIRQLKNCILGALRNATMIGTIVNFKCEPAYVKLMDTVQKNVELHRTTRGFSTGQFVSRLLQNNLKYLVEGRTMLSVITCRDLRDYIREHTGIADVKEYIIPSQHVVRSLVDGAYERNHYGGKRLWPDLHDDIQRNIVVREAGEVFIVAAGLFGKDLCITIQERGGIALDMGSSVDYWVMKRTRGKNKGLMK